MGLRGPSLFCLLAALSYALAINNGEKHRASNVLDAQEGSRVGTLTSMEAGVGAEPVSVSIAAAMAVTVTVVKVSLEAWELVRAMYVVFLPTIDV